jgi:hypothetical protein
MGSEVPIVMTIFGSFGWTVWTISNSIRRSKATRVVAELHAKLLDRCAGSQDLVTYMESDTGKRFLESVTTGQASPSTRILNAIQSGAILGVIGAAILIVMKSTNQDYDVVQVFTLLGSIILATGLGFLISAGISYILCRSWGLLKPADDRR